MDIPSEKTMEERKEEISTRQLLEETLRAYVWIVNAVIVPGKKQGRVMVKDIKLANAMIERMATLSNLIEKEQSRTSS